MSDAQPLLDVRGLCKYFPVKRRGIVSRTTGWVRAVDDVSFQVRPGETLGLVGESGSGKTTAARAILRAIRPSRGDVLLRLDGETVNLAHVTEHHLKRLRTRMQLIFQDPFSSLNPRMTVGDIVGEPLRIHRLARGAALRARVEDMLVRVGLKREHLNRYPHAFSGGQRQRIGIARALVMNPSLVIADEPVAALDVSVQAQVINLLKDLQDELKLTYVFVAHNLAVVRHISDRVAVMYAGRIVEMAPSDALFNDPKHPYTQGLLAAVPYPDPDVPMRAILGGEVADPARLPTGCAFHPRCARCFAPCDKVTPAPRVAGPGHWVACHLYPETDPSASTSAAERP